MIHAVPNQLLCNDIQHGKSVLDDRGKFSIQPLLYQLRHRISIDFLCLCSGNAHQIFLCAVNGRGKCPHGERTDFLNLICDGIGVGDNYLISAVFSQVGEFLKHFLRCPQIKGRLTGSIFKALSCLKDFPVDGIFRIHKVHVTGSADRNSQFIAQCKNFPVVFLQFFHIGRRAVSNHECVIAGRLDFQIIVEFRKVYQFLMGFVFHKSLEQLSGFTGAAENQTLPILHQYRFGNQRLSVKALNVAV